MKKANKEEQIKIETIYHKICETVAKNFPDLWLACDNVGNSMVVCILGGITRDHMWYVAYSYTYSILLQVLHVQLLIYGYKALLNACIYKNMSALAWLYMHELSLLHAHYSIVADLHDGRIDFSLNGWPTWQQLYKFICGMVTVHRNHQRASI